MPTDFVDQSWIVKFTDWLIAFHAGKGNCQGLGRPLFLINELAQSGIESVRIPRACGLMLVHEFPKFLLAGCPELF
jgi:hypothetical protein